MADRLQRYRDKRQADRTPEPSGSPAPSSQPAQPPPDDPHFVIQHHLARADHYDFRLEIDGVLVSWAVPKGPSTDPRVRRMAKRTEDHPLDYEDFEGVIGRGQYGGGTVQVWDRGTFVTTSRDGDASAALADGHLSVVLAGEKLRGGYTLIRTRDRERGDDMWLLMKKKDADADARRNPTSTQTESVLTGRTMEEIAAEDARRK